MRSFFEQSECMPTFILPVNVIIGPLLGNFLEVNKFSSVLFGVERIADPSKKIPADALQPVTTTIHILCEHRPSTSVW